MEKNILDMTAEEKQALLEQREKDKQKLLNPYPLVNIEKLNPQWVCYRKPLSGINVYKKPATVIEYGFFKYVLPRMYQLNPNYDVLSPKKQRELLHRALDELTTEYPDGFETPSWLENKPTAPTIHHNQKYSVEPNVSCPRCGSTNIKSHGAWSYRCSDCGRFFPKQPKYPLRR